MEMRRAKDPNFKGGKAEKAGGKAVAGDTGAGRVGVREIEVAAGQTVCSKSISWLFMALGDFCCTARGLVRPLKRGCLIDPPSPALSHRSCDGKRWM